MAVNESNSQGKSSVAKSSLVMAIATFCSRILGLVREQVMAAYFGASGWTDAFHVAYRIPNLMRDLFAEGAFSAAFVPKFVEARNGGHDKARDLLWTLFILLGFITGLIGLGIILGSDQIVHFFAPKFDINSDKFALTSQLTKLMAFYLMFVSLAALFMGVLNSVKIFFMPAMAPALFNVVVIIFMLGLTGYLKTKGINPIFSLGIGVLIGGFFQVLMQLPFVIKKGYGPVKIKKFFSKDALNVFKLLGPGLLGFAATQINILVNTILATSTVVGAVSWLQYGFRLFQLPVGIASVSIGNANLVHFSTAWKNGDEDKAKSFLQSSYNLSMLLMIPALISLVFFGDHMVNVIFQRGQFGAGDTEQTAKAIFYYALGLPFYGVYKIFVPTFYTLDRPMLPVKASVISIAFNIGFCIYMVPKYGFAILALGTSLSMLINSFIQSLALKKLLNLKLSFWISKKTSFYLLSGAISLVACYFIKTNLVFRGRGFALRCLVLGGELIALASIYFLILLICGQGDEIKKILAKIKNRLM